MLNIPGEHPSLNEVHVAPFLDSCVMHCRYFCLPLYFGLCFVCPPFPTVSDPFGFVKHYLQQVQLRLTFADNVHTCILFLHCNVPYAKRMAKQ